MGITPEMHDLIVPGDRHDPIAAQFIPDPREEIILPQEVSDPVGDYTHAPLKALVHRHDNRVLLKATMVCAVYCRFCFRREMIGPNGDTITQSDLDEALEYIAAHPEITEVILTGGDPLVLSPKKLQSLMQRLGAIPHLRWVRLHSRVPVVSPGKISPDMLAALKSAGKPVLLAIHANHPREFTPAARAALADFADSGIVLLGQSVLLKGINDTAPVLAELLETMMVNRIKPYYLHHPDLTAGTSHFRLSFEEGMALMAAIQPLVSGVCIPQYTLDIPGGVTKIAITPDTVRAVPGRPGAYELRDPMGKVHDYEDRL